MDQNIALYHKYAKLLVSMEKKIPPNFYLIDQSRNAMKGWILLSQATGQMDLLKLQVKNGIDFLLLNITRSRTTDDSGRKDVYVNNIQA